jgi:hypothetical protein
MRPKIAKNVLLPSMRFFTQKSMRYTVLGFGNHKNEAKNSKKNVLIPGTLHTKIHV